MTHFHSIFNILYIAHRRQLLNIDKRKENIKKMINTYYDNVF